MDERGAQPASSAPPSQAANSRRDRPGLFMIRVGLPRHCGGRTGEWCPVDREHHQRRCRAERAAGNAVLAAPASIGVLDAVEIFRGGLIPFGPGVASLLDEAFADVEVTEKLLAAV